MSVTLRPMSEDDFPHVVTWLAEPEVRRWWYQPLDLAAVRAKYLPRLLGVEPTHMIVIEVHAVPVGLAQWYRWDDYPDDQDSYGLGRGELGMDYAIGVASARGRGVGSGAIDRLLAVMRREHAAGTAVSVTPQVANAASCRVLEKNGFELASRVQPDPLPGREPEGLTAVYRRLL